ncbi:MAG TPA: DUF5667 domain-containing protein [Mycobacteriales bacterium]|nr:DUF5667 domain-containing protein [Mycobacteriales bacterium]
MVVMVRSRRAGEFARLVDLAVDRQSTEAARYFAEDSRTTELLTVAHALREVRLDAGPDPEFAQRLRRRLVAVASVKPPELVDEATQPVPRPRNPLSLARGGAGLRGSAHRPAAHRSRPQRSPKLAFLAGTLAAMVLVTGLTMLASSRALPGDALYALKRSSEHLELALVHDPKERGLRQLGFAQTRLGEVQKLLGRGGVPLDPRARTGPDGEPLATGDTSLVSQVLRDMDSDTLQGVRLLMTYAVQKSVDAPLATLSGWATDQRAELSSVLALLPEPASAQARESLVLLDRLTTRIQQLRGGLACSCLTGRTVDDLGPVPCSPCVPLVAPTTPEGSSGQRSGGPLAPVPGGPSGTSTPLVPGLPNGSGAPAPTRPGTLPTVPAGQGTTPPPLLPLPPIFGG